MDPISAIFVMTVLGGLFVKGVDVATDGLLSAEVGAGVRGAAGYAVRAERARWGRACSKAREIRMRTPQGQAVQEFLDIAGMFVRVLSGEAVRFGSGVRSEFRSGRDQARSARTERRGGEPWPIVRAARSGAVRAREWAERRAHSDAATPNEPEPNGATEPGADGTFFHASHAKLKPGDPLTPGARLPSRATSQGHAWYTSQGPDVAWRMSRVWLWPTLAQAQTWASALEQEAIYEVRAVDAKPLDCCDHTSTKRGCDTGGDCGWGQQWHAASATVVRLVSGDPNGASSDPEREPNTTTTADPNERRTAKSWEPATGCLFVLDWHDEDERRRPDFCGKERESGWVYCPRHMQEARDGDRAFLADDLEDLRAEYYIDLNGDPNVPLESTVPNQNGDVRCGCCALLHKPLAPGQHCPACHIHAPEHLTAPTQHVTTINPTRGPSMDITSAPAAIAAWEAFAPRWESLQSRADALQGEIDSLKNDADTLHGEIATLADGMGDFAVGGEVDTAAAVGELSDAATSAKERADVLVDSIGTAKQAVDAHVDRLHDDFNPSIEAAAGQVADAHAVMQEA